MENAFPHLPVTDLADVTHNFEHLLSEARAQAAEGGSTLPRVEYGLIGGGTGELLYVSPGFTVVHSGVGSYEVVWATAKLTAHYTVVATANTGERGTFAQVFSIETAKFVVGTSKGAEAINSNFSFIALSSS
jgi:hypothetical protein